MLDYIWLVPLFPMLGVLLNALFSRWLGKKMVGYLACGAVGLSFIASLLIFSALVQLPGRERFLEKTLFAWISASGFRVAMALQVDSLSVLMSLVVTGVGFLIHVYSLGYMDGDPGYARYFAYLNLFILSMLTLVLANNFLLLYLGWEVVGLCSYLLIGFWYQRQAAANAAKKAFIVTRVGDMGFMLGVILIVVTFSTLDFKRVFEMAPQLLPAGGLMATAITLLLLAGAVGKSAQIPLYVWLPDAMEGPTPVSALIHAATMVTAGVYMIARTHVLFQLAPLSMGVVATLGALTALYAATIALVQNDIKRVLAYSTISQLGYMFLAVGVGAYTAGLFHLTTHAFFKALLFLGAGSVMHALANETNVQKMGGLYPYLKATALTFIVAWLAISGLPPFSGFFSKEEILAEAFRSGHTWLWAIGVFTAFLTAFYASRLVFLTFFGESRLEAGVAGHVHESPPIMTVPLVVLALLAATGGLLGFPPGESSAIHRFLAPVFATAPHAAGEVAAGGFSELTLATISTAMALLGIFVAWLMYIRRGIDPTELAQTFRPAYQLLFNKYYVDELYGALIVGPTVRTATFLSDRFEVKVINGLVNGLAGWIGRGSALLRRVQSGYVRNYALSILAGVVLIVWYLVLR